MMAIKGSGSMPAENRNILSIMQYILDCFKVNTQGILSYGQRGRSQPQKLGKATMDLDLIILLNAYESTIVSELKRKTSHAHKIKLRNLTTLGQLLNFRE